MSSNKNFGVFLVAALFIALPVAAEEGREPHPHDGHHQVHADQELGDMVITGTRTPRRADKAPIKTEVVGRDEIELLGARTLADAIEHTNGVYVENDCQNCNFSQIRMQGLEAGYTQILNDGQATMSSLASVYGIEHIPTALVERVEIVKGGASTLYGSNAVAGVVNVIPREPNKNGFEVKQEIGFFDHGPPNRSTSAVVDLVTEDHLYGVTAFGQVDYVQPFDENDDGFSDISKREFFSGGGRGFAYIGDAGKLTVDYVQVREDRRGGDVVKTEPETRANIAESVVSESYMPSVKWNHEITPELDYQLSYAYAKTERDSYYGAGMDPNAYGVSESEVFVYDGQVNLRPLEDHVFSVGIQHTTEELIDRQPAYNRTIDQEIQDLGVFGQHEWDITDRFNLVYGLRIDDNSAVDDEIFSPRIGARFEAIDDLTLRASYSTGFRAPQVFDEDLHITQSGGEGQVIRNAAGLTEEKSQSYSLGAEWQPRGDLFFAADVFYTILEDTFFVQETDDPATTNQTEFTRINQGGSEVYGAELNAGYQWEQLKFEAGYGWLQARYDSPEADFNQRDFFRTPEDYGVVRVTWAIEDTQIVVAGRYIGDMKVPFLQGDPAQELRTTERFFPVDIGINQTFHIDEQNDVILQAGIKNVFDEFQEDLDRGADRDSAYVYGPRYPRTFYTSLSWKY